MSDIVVKSALIPSLGQVLGEVDALSGLTPKGAYAFGKQVDAVTPAFARYQKERMKRLTGLALKGPDGKPITQTTGTVMQFDFGGGFGVVPEHVTTALDELNDEDVPLSGVRTVVVAELGTAKLTPAQSRVLIAAKLLEDREPE